MKKPVTIVLVEPDAATRAHLGAALERSRVIVVAVPDRAGLERALRVHEVALVALARDCGVEALDAREGS